MDDLKVKWNPEWDKTNDAFTEVAEFEGGKLSGTNSTQQRNGGKIMKRPLNFVTGMAMATALAGGGAAAQVAAPPEPQRTLITNTRIFDGTSPALSGPMSVLVEGNKIARIESSLAAPEGTRVLDAAGRTLMPGLTDCHWHTLQTNVTNAEALSSDLGYLSLAAAVGAERTLMRGFTTVRDVGGPIFSLKKMIDAGVYPGPRIYPSGAYITQTSGHADFRSPLEVPRPYARDLIPQEQMGIMVVADGKPQVIQRVRENLMKGASQIKVLAGGGVASPSDPLDVSQYTQDELKAAVEVAESWNTYVAVHAYTAKAVQNALRAGVKSIEHGQLMDDETAQLIQESDAWVCMQPFLDDEDAIPFPPGSFSAIKYQQLVSGTDTAYRLVKKHDLNMGFGTDTQNDPALAERQGAQLAKLARWFEPWEVLRFATSANYELFKLSGPRDPYPGKNGVIEEGALADMILVDGNPLENIDLISDPDRNFLVIMKDGKIYKNIIE